MIPVTKPFFPPSEEYFDMLTGVWERGILTNNGPLVKELEEEVPKFLNSYPMRYVTNGTIALQLAIRALKLIGEIITTPFSFVATSSAIKWEGCRPVFVDIDPLTFNLDVAKIESAITDKTSAILATHVYGNPCDVVGIQRIADKYGLKVIYDAAHCFGINYLGQSIFNYGDISICSFHATKVFHTIEGGGVFSLDNGVLRRVELLRNFGHDGPYNFQGIGINAKQTEVHAAMGLVNLKYINSVLDRRVQIFNLYNELLTAKKVTIPKWLADNANGAYVPVVLNDSPETLMADLEALNIATRRYFYPLISSSEGLPIAQKISSNVLCLPVYYDLDDATIREIVSHV